MKYLLCLIIAAVPYFSRGQNPVSLPQIINYGITEYKAGIHNWGMGQGKEGLIYFGNNEGMLSFDGKIWKKYHLPNYTIIRTIKTDEQGRIFVGGQDDIGYFFPDEKGQLQYHSFNSLIPVQEQKFADIRNIELYDKSVFFRSYKKIFQYKDGVIRVFPANKEWGFMGSANGQLFAQEKSSGLMRYENGVWKTLLNLSQIKDNVITSVLEYGKDTLLVTTLTDGLYTYSKGQFNKKPSNAEDLFKNHRISCATRVNDNWFALGTTSAGVLVIDKQGQLVEHYGYTEGLDKNNIRGVFLDQNKNLWVGMDDGIGFIAVNHAIRHIYPDKEKQASSYAIQIFRNRLFVGTSNGLYATTVLPAGQDLSAARNTSFKEIENSKGQVWSLTEINDHLLIGHEDGSKVLKDNSVTQMSSGSGTWIYQPASGIFPSPDIIAGTYTGLQHLTFKNGQFESAIPISGIDASLRFIVIDGQQIWASHPSRGVFRIQLSADKSKILKISHYDDKNGLPSALYNYAYKVKNRLVMATKNGVYEYNSKTDRFEPSALLQPAFEGISLQFLKEDLNGNIWFVSSKRVGVADFQNHADGKNFSMVYFPELNSKVIGGFETIYPYNNTNVFVGAGKGVFHINYAKYLKNIRKPNVMISRITLPDKNDSLVFGGYYVKAGKTISSQSDVNIPDLRPGLNSLHFEVSSAMFDQLNSIEFSYQLVGFDDKWSKWTSSSDRTYNNLSPGKYTFQVKSRNNLGSESAQAAYTFIIDPAWYQSNVFYILVIASLIALVYYIFRWQHKQNIRQQQKLSYLHQLELEKTEQEIVRLQKENLETEMEYKNRELTSLTMHLAHRANVLEKIKEVLSAVVKKDDGAEEADTFRPLLRMIRNVNKNDEEHSQFSEQFNAANADLFKALKSRFSDMSANDLKLCAYVRLNLSSKQIAEMMNVSVKAIEVARYRLRKKLGLPYDTNLHTYLNEITNGSL